jgi:GMP synthase-like glutamine amidotransferase
MAKALGGKVGRNRVKEIGWGKVEVLPSSRAQYWFGHAAPAFDSFHWHGETFSIPPNGERVLGNEFCENQAFALGEKHLAMQCHIEMTSEMIDVWCETGASSIAHSKSPAVQPVDVIKAQAVQRLPALNQVADGVYERWIKGLKG